MVANLGGLAGRRQVFHQALPRVSPFHAVRRSSSPLGVRVLVTLGTSFDCASQYATHHGVQLLVFDSEGELIKVPEPGTRLVSGCGPRAVEASSPLSAKSGASLEVCEHLLKSVRDPGWWWWEPGGHWELVYYLNKGHFCAFHVSLREPEPKMPIVLKLCPEPPLFSCTLYGSTCGASDGLFLEETQLPEWDMGDWLVFPPRAPTRPP
ncbi:hypothetical protein CB1_000256010 [Camelus ferus]|nr:hypothetical protein CB1_000256010 [Camelus ferus]